MVRVINSKGEQLGVLDIKKALSLAENEGLDLVEIAPNATPPVCKIISISKFNYLEEQKKKANKSSKQDLKEIRLTSRIEDHDFETKVKQITKFLSQGHKVKVSLLFKGRESSKPEAGRRVVDDLLLKISEFGELQSKPSHESRGIFLTIHPKRS